MGIFLALGLPEHGHRFSPIGCLCIRCENPHGVAGLSLAGHLMSVVVAGWAVELRSVLGEESM